MLDALIESRHARRYRNALSGGALSILVHSSLIAGAVYATLHSGSTHAPAHIVVPIDLTVSPAPPPQPGGGVVVPLPGPVVLSVSPEIPPVIPPPSTVPFDPTRYSGFGPDSAVIPGPGLGPAPDPTAVYAPTMVEERPERIGGPAPRYPEMLRQAGIEGEVVVECVIDTLGRAEPGSIRIVSSTHSLFERPAREAVAALLFRPARLDGRVVRVRVQLPIQFRMARGSAGP